ncbi:MAG: hypothetical protein IJU23_00485 [Proteobacteria bacterium]|nr:hypothetical protein [Pseudomonadota bacterium]
MKTILRFFVVIISLFTITACDSIQMITGSYCESESYKWDSSVQHFRTEFCKEIGYNLRLDCYKECKKRPQAYSLTPRPGHNKSAPGYFFEECDEGIGRSIGLDINECKEWIVEQCTKDCITPDMYIDKCKDDYTGTLETCDPPGSTFAQDILNAARRARGARY